jgi:acetylornithine deacetylase/succinyl-diaminopimelate desuccinylase-like protein
MRIWIISTLTIFALASPAFAQPANPIRDWRAAHETQILDDMANLARMKSIAADPQATIAAAKTLQQMLKTRGIDSRLLSAGDGIPPVVYADIETPGAKRTVVFYAHYDGQPVTPSQWKSDPFVPVLRNGTLDTNPKDIDWHALKPPYNPEWRMYARAIADDKISIIAFLEAWDAMKAAGEKPSVNIKIVWEGEEEAGSTHLAQILAANKGLLGSDLWLIGDGPIHPSRLQEVYFGARGVIGVDATIYGPIRALHDGHYGNWAPNPGAMAANLLAEMRDDDGNIRIPHFADDVRPLSQAEKDAIATLPPVEKELKDEYQIGRSEGHEGLTLSTMRPALNIRGIRSGAVSAEAPNAVPVDAEISIDFRLVPDQTPRGVRQETESYLKSLGWTIVADAPDKATRLAHSKLIRLVWEDGYAALRSDMSSPAAKAVIAAATRAAGRPIAILPMSGGSVPLHMFADLFPVPIICLPIANHDDSQHAANENIRLQNVWDGIETYASLMSSLNW